GDLLLLLGDVGDAQQELGIRALPQQAEVVGVGEFVEPRPAGCGDAGAGVGADDGGDQALLVGGAEVAVFVDVTDLAGFLPAALGAEAQLGHVDAGAFGFAAGPAAGVGGLELGEPAGAGL